MTKDREPGLPVTGPSPAARPGPGAHALAGAPLSDGTCIPMGPATSCGSSAPISATFSRARPRHASWRLRGRRARMGDRPLPPTATGGIFALLAAAGRAHLLPPPRLSPATPLGARAAGPKWRKAATGGTPPCTGPRGAGIFLLGAFGISAGASAIGGCMRSMATSVGLRQGSRSPSGVTTCGGKPRARCSVHGRRPTASELAGRSGTGNRRTTRQWIGTTGAARTRGSEESVGSRYRRWNPSRTR